MNVQHKHLCLQGITSMATNEQKQNEQKNGSENKSDPNLLDLAFAMDCTGSMGSYIQRTQQNIRQIVEEIVAKEHADTRLALVEYRDHPPQDHSFITRPHDFTSSVREMKGWLDRCTASGGGDGPEAVADALHQVLKLSWRDNATKICVFISDAPPHGLQPAGDGFPNGCPAGIDPMEVANQIAEKGITMYMVGCEPSIVPYKDWFMAIAHMTGGQYVPLHNASLLAKVIIGGAREEISLQQLMEEVNQEVLTEFGNVGELDEEKVSKNVLSKLKSKGAYVQQLQMGTSELPASSALGQNLAKVTNMADVRKQWKAAPMSAASVPAPAGYGFSFGTASRASSAMGGAMPMDVDPMPVAGADVSVVEQQEVSFNQAQRMVSKSIMTNKLGRFKKK